MFYDEENIIKIKKQYDDIRHIHRQLILKHSCLRSKLTDKKACEFFTIQDSVRIRNTERTLYLMVRDHIQA